MSTTARREHNRPIHVNREPARRERAPRERREPPTVETAEDALSELGINSFEKEYRRLLRLTGADEFSSQQATQALVRAQLASAIRAMKLIDDGLHSKNGGGARLAYSLVAIGDHIRALSNDLRMGGDQSALVEKIRRDAMQPALASCATSIVADLTTMRSDVHGLLDAKSASAMDKRLRAMQSRLASIFRDAEAQAHELVERALSS